MSSASAKQSDGDSRRPPAGLASLVRAYATEPFTPVRYRPSSWARALGQEATAWLTAENVSRPSDSVPGDRLIDADDLGKRLAGMGLDGAGELRQAFVAVMAWGSGTSAPRSYRHTAAALRDGRLDATLRETAELWRQPDTAALEAAYTRWRVNGVGRSFFTKWFRFAGHVPGRSWQPLILDDRVLATLNHTLGLTTQDLAGKRRWAARYRAYVEALHHWSEQLRDTDPEADAGRLEWILFRHNGQTDLHHAVKR